MNSLLWTPYCSVGNNEIDRQHRKMLDLCNEIGSHLGDSSYSSKFHELLNELVELSSYHLAFEERILQENHYPDFEAHKHEHEKHRDALAYLLILAMDKKLDYKALHDFASGWWNTHVLVSDIKAKQYLKEKPL